MAACHTSRCALFLHVNTRQALYCITSCCRIKGETCHQASTSTHQFSSRYASSSVVSVADPTPEQITQAKTFEEVPKPVNVKGPLGSVLSIYDAWKKDTFKRPHMAITKHFKELGPIYKLQLGNGSYVVHCMDTKDIEFVYHNDGKYPQRMHIEAWKEYRRERKKPFGVLIDDGEAWSKQRNILSKRILRPPELAKFTSIMNEVAQELAAKLKHIRVGNEGGEKADIVKDLEIELNKWAMESSSKFFFDRKLDLLAKDLKEENQAFFDAIGDLTENSIFLLAIPLTFHKRFNSRPYRKTNAAWDTIFSLSKKYVDEKTQQIEDRKRRGEAADDGSYLAYLLENGQLTHEEIYGNMTELLAASVDTTASTSMWMLHLLSRNPNVQSKLHEEVMRVIPEDIHPTREHIDSMPYLKAVVKETLRLYPVTQGTARELPVDAILHGYFIPARTPILTCFFVSGRSSDNYEDPNEFRPERWLVDAKKTNPFASQPFGFGTRMCLGRRVAEQELYLLACQMTRNFVLESNQDVGSVSKLLIIPEQPLQIKFIDRT